MSGMVMWLTFVTLLAFWLAGVVTGVGGPVVHVLLVLAILDLTVGALPPRKA